MRKIISLTPADNFTLYVKFDNGCEKQFDFKPYFNYPVFNVLKNEDLFKQVSNKSYFIEWPGYDIDLSADTLWHESVDCVSVEH